MPFSLRSQWFTGADAFATRSFRGSRFTISSVYIGHLANFYGHCKLSFEPTTCSFGFTVLYFTRDSKVILKWMDYRNLSIRTRTAILCGRNEELDGKMVRVDFPSKRNFCSYLSAIMLRMFRGFENLIDANSNFEWSDEKFSGKGYRIFFLHEVYVYVLRVLLL